MSQQYEDYTIEEVEEGEGRRGQQSRWNYLKKTLEIFSRWYVSLISKLNTLISSLFLLNILVFNQFLINIYLNFFRSTIFFSVERDS